MLATAISGSPAINGCELEDLNPKMKRGTVIYLNHKRGRKQRSNLCYRMSMKLTNKEKIRAKGHGIFLSQEDFVFPVLLFLAYKKLFSWAMMEKFQFLYIMHNE